MAGTGAVFKAAAALAMTLTASCDLPLGDWPTYQDRCRMLALRVKGRCADQTDASPRAVAACQVAQLRRAGYDAGIRENEAHCVEPFTLLPSREIPLHERCTYVLTSIEGACYDSKKDGGVSSLEQCVVENMARASLYALGRDFERKPGTTDLFVCSEETAAGHGSGPN